MLNVVLEWFGLKLHTEDLIGPVAPSQPPSRPTLSLGSSRPLTPWGKHLTVLLGLSAALSISEAATTPGSLVGWGLNTQGQATPPTTKFISFSLGDYHSLGITESGSVIGWGNNGQGQITIPSALSAAKAVSGGTFHSLGLDINGKVYAWGDTFYNQGLVPLAAQGVATAIAAGANHNLVLLATGKVVGWGDNSQNQAAVPSNLLGVSAIAAGQSHSMALTGGRIVVWGSDTYRQRSSTPSGNTYVGIAAGANHCVALRNDGRVLTWGDNTYGQLNVPGTITGVARVLAGGNVTVLQLTNRTLLVYGETTYGQTTPPSGLTNVVEVAAGTFHMLARKVDPPLITTQPADVKLLPGETLNLSVVATGSTPFTYQWKRNGTDISSATNATYSITDIKLTDAASYSVLISNEATATLSRSAVIEVLNPPVIKTQPQSVDAAEGSRVTLTVLATGPNLTYRWRKNQVPIPNAVIQFLTFSSVTQDDVGNYDVVITNNFGAVTSTVARLQVFAVPGIVTEPVSVETYAGAVTRLKVVATNATSFEWRLNGTAVPGATEPILNFEEVRPEDAGTYTVKAINAWGSQTSTPVTLTLIPPQTFPEIVGWGETQAWNGAKFVRLTPPEGMSAITHIASGTTHQLALRSDGNLIGWGDDSHGEAFPPEPIQNIVKLAAGDGFSLALQNSGTVKAWGRNDRGQGSIPANLSDAVDVACGKAHGLALRTNGNVVAWGDNSFGQGSVLPNLGKVRAIAAGADFNVVVLQNGSLTAWGNNSTSQSRPPLNAEGMIAVAAGRMHGLALKSDGTVIAWGDNTSGQTNVPIFTSPAIAIAAANDHSMALLRNGHVVVWGKNNSGQREVPTTLQSVHSIATGGDHCIVLQFQSLQFSLFEQTPQNILNLQLNHTDGTAISASEAGKIQILTSPVIDETDGTWTPWDGTLSLKDGVLQGTGIGTTAGSRFFRATRNP